MDQPNQEAGNNDTVPLMDPENITVVSGLNPDLIANVLPGTLPADMAMPDQPLLGYPAADGSMPDASSFTIPIIFNGNNPAAVAPPAANKIITADEIALYDRQIRLWGMAAQAKIQSANILLITIRALANEIAKNLVLAGVGSLTLLDDATVTESDLGAQFLLLSEVVENPPPIGQNRAEAAKAALQKLNPRVNIYTDPQGVSAKGPAYFSGFDVVIATDLDPDSFNIINTSTRINGKTFYAAGTHGLYGFIFSDLIEHDFIIKRDLGNVATELKHETRTRSIVHVETHKEGGSAGGGGGGGGSSKVTESVTKRELYSTWFLASDAAVLPPEFTRSKRRLKSVTPILSCFRALWAFLQARDGGGGGGGGGGRLPYGKDDYKLFTQITTQKHRALSLPSETLTPEVLRSFLQNLGCEIAPTTAILGGQLAQDVINVLGQTQQPIQNMVIFDGNTMEAPMYALHPEGMPLGSSLLSALSGAMDPASSAAASIVPPFLPPMNGMPTNNVPLDATMGLMNTDMPLLTPEQMAQLAPLQTGYGFMQPDVMNPTAQSAIQPQPHHQVQQPHQVQQSQQQQQQQQQQQDQPNPPGSSNPSS